MVEYTFVEENKPALKLNFAWKQSDIEYFTEHSRPWSQIGFWQGFLTPTALYRHTLNIARGTTDPGIASISWIISSATKQANSVERKIQHSIGSNFDHQVALTALVPNLPTRWRHLPWLEICISSKFGHQMAPLALVRLGKIEARVKSFKFQPGHLHWF